MKSILLQCHTRHRGCSVNTLFFSLLLLCSLFFSSDVTAQDRKDSFTNPAKCGMEELVKTARGEGLYDENNKEYQAFVKKAREEYDARQAQKTDSDCPNGIVVLPIAFHIFHESGAAIGTQHNFDVATLNELVGSLNADFGGYNTNKDLIDECFQDVDAYNTCIQFCIGQINRIDITSCGSCAGGCDYTTMFSCSQAPPNDFLNIYSAQFGGGLLGVASSIPFPGNPLGNCIENNDGVYVDWDSFTVGPPANAPFDGGKTLTHELGHWLGLYHIGGDGTCANDDGLGDTPTQNGQNGGCPAGQNDCNDGVGDKPDMYVNHMDYSDDACLAMFTQDQAAVMQAVLGYGGATGPAPAGCRSVLACSSGRGNCNNTLLTLDNTPVAANSQNITITACEGSLDLTDIQFAWYGYASGNNCFNWTENGADVIQIGDYDAMHPNLACGGGGDDTRTFNLEIQAWDEVNKTWGATQDGGTVNLIIECPPTVAESDSQTDDTAECMANPMLAATCPACPCAFDNANMTMTITMTGTHSWVSDLAFYLQGPSGTITMGTSTCNNSGANFNGLIFTSGATNTYDGCGAATPLTGSNTVDFSALDGDAFSGSWNLIVGDCANFDTGTLTSFSITIEDNGMGNSCLAGMPGGITFSGGSGAAIGDNMCGGGLTEAISFPVVTGSPADITWWDAATGGNQVATGANFDTSTDAAFNNNSNGTTTYYVECGCDPCNSNRVAVDATIQNCVPVELLAFTGAALENKVVLDWATASEFNNSHFEVERSFDGQKFSMLGKVQGAGTTVISQLYNFVDIAPKTDINYYRLKQIDFDGTFEYSSTIAIDMSKEQMTTEVYPSPAADILNIRVNKEIDYIQIFDLTGRAVMQSRLSETTFTQLDVSGLLSGTYFVSIQSENTTEVVRFIKK